MQAYIQCNIQSICMKHLLYTTFSAFWIYIPWFPRTSQLSYLTITTVNIPMPTPPWIIGNLLPHPISSLPSVQSRLPSQRSEELIHVPLLHRNAPLWQETVQNVTSSVELPTAAEVDNCQIVEKLTAVPLITSIRAGPNSSASWTRGGDTLAIATSKLGGAAT